MTSTATEAPAIPGASIPDAVEPAEAELCPLGLPVEPGARVAEILRRQDVAAAEADQAREQAEHAARLRDVVTELVELGWTVKPPA